jgi:site-specific recombinase XerD
MVYRYCLQPRIKAGMIFYLQVPKSPALFVSSRDTRISVDRLYQIVGGLAESAGIDRVVSPHKIRHSSITALLDLNGGDVRSAQAHSRHKNLATLIRYDDGRQQLACNQDTCKTVPRTAETVTLKHFQS